MNRIILIGNGFDLAHDIKTSYSNFLNDYWRTEITSIKKLQYHKTFENEEFKINNIHPKNINGYSYSDLKTCIKDKNLQIYFKNSFLEKITEKHAIEKWVDVENEYYSQLKDIYKNSKPMYQNHKIIKLNSDFARIKILLQIYLKKEFEDFRNRLKIDYNDLRRTIGSKIYYPFKLNNFSEHFLNQKVELEYNANKNYIEDYLKDNNSINDLDDKTKKFVQRISTKHPLVEIRKIIKSDFASNFLNLNPIQILFLSFNYTNTEQLYINPKEFDYFEELVETKPKVIHIHGTVYPQENNPIIFGFGDELDEDYKSIENLNKNEYLENIKSINYLDNDNYKTLLEFINSDFFQIFIFGHSCGISDRTLLNTIFEHENCVSIKLFYHKKSDESDNYSDIIRNISRNFNDKAKMRDKVVNKKYCEPLV